MKTLTATKADHQSPDAPEEGELTPTSTHSDDEAPPLPDELPPPLESNPTEDDGWDARFDPSTQTYYFFNRVTGVSQWENPRMPDATTAAAPGTSSMHTQAGAAPALASYQGYNPKVHGDYDPNADYAKFHEPQSIESEVVDPVAAAADAHAQEATFNRFTGKFQAADKTTDYHNDANKSKRQMSAFFDVDSAANEHDGRSLKAERVGQKLSKSEIKAFNSRRREKKEQKRRAFLMS